MGHYDPSPYQLDLTQYPYLATKEIPGPRSVELHQRASVHYRGLSGQVRLFPVAFEKGFGCSLEDADGNRYIDFSSGIYVTTWDNVSEDFGGRLHICEAPDECAWIYDEIKVRLFSRKWHRCCPGI